MVPLVRLLPIAGAFMIASACSVYHTQVQHLTAKFRRAGVEVTEFDLPNGHVRWWHGGSGTPLLLLHGFGGDAMFLWHPQVRSLARDHEVIVPDLLWFGGSDSSHEDYTTTFQAETALQLLDHIGIEEFDMIGVSYGGLVALELAVIAPNRVQQMVIVDSPGHTYTLEDYAALCQRNDIGDIAELVIPREPAGIKRLVQLAYHRPPPVPPFVQRDLFRHMFARNIDEKHALIDDLIHRAGTIDPTDYDTQHDTLVIWGEHDDLFPVEVGRRLATALQADFIVIPRTNHAPNIERPRQFNQHVHRFLAPQLE